MDWIIILILLEGLPENYNPCWMGQARPCWCDSEISVQILVVVASTQARTKFGKLFEESVASSRTNQQITSLTDALVWFLCYLEPVWKLYLFLRTYERWKGTDDTWILKKDSGSACKAGGAWIRTGMKLVDNIQWMVDAMLSQNECTSRMVALFVTPVCRPKYDLH